MRVVIYPEPIEERYLSPKEVACRIFSAYPGSVVDWAKGDALIQRTLNDLIALGTPAIVLDSHKSLFGHTAFIQMQLPDFPGTFFQFVVYPYDSIWIEEDDENRFDLLKTAAEQLYRARQQLMPFKLKNCQELGGTPCKGVKNGADYASISAARRIAKILGYRFRIELEN